MSVNIEWDGKELVGLEQSMRSATGRVTTEVRTALKESGDRIAAAARTLAPRRTGKLQDSISSTLTSGHGGTEASAEIGPAAHYGRFQEHGTAKMAAHPFLGPALEANSDEAAEAVADAALKGMQL